MIPQPKRREALMWMFWVMALAIVGLFGTLVQMYTSTRAELRAKDAELSACQKEQAQIQREFREELSQVFDRVNKAIQDVERAKRKRGR